MIQFASGAADGPFRTAATRPARIGHVLPWPAVGGTEHATLRIARAVQGDSFDSVAFCVENAGPVTALLESGGVPWTTYAPPVPSYRHYPRYLSQSLALARQFRAQGVDLVHCADLAAGSQAALAGWLARVPVICHIRNRFDDVSRRDASFLWPVRTFVFVSRNTWDGFAANVPESRGRVLYDGIALPSSSPVQWADDRRSVCHEFGIPADAAIVGTMARVSLQKDFPTLIRAARLVLARHPRTRFLVVGDHSSDAAYREHYRELQSLLAAEGMTESFVFTDYRRDVPRFLAALDVFVLSTHWEGLPLVLLEAMAYARPVVATAVDGVPEAIDHDRTGVLVPHEDVGALAAGVNSILDDRAFASAMGEAGRQAVQERFSVAAFEANLRALYADALGR